MENEQNAAILTSTKSSMMYEMFFFALRGLPARKDLLNNSQLKIEDGFPNQAAILNHIIISTQSSQEILKNSTASCHIF